MLTVMDSNIEHVIEVVRTLAAAGSSTIYVNYGIPNIVRELDTGCDASPQALARLSEDLFRMQSALGVRFVFNREKNKIPLCHFNHDVLKDMFAAEVIGTGCEAVQGNTVIIEPGGNALGCSHWVEHPLLNIYRDYSALELLTANEFWERWMTGRPLEFRESLKWFPYEQCGDCGWRRDGLCWGGCKVWQSAGVLPRHARYDDGPQTSLSGDGRVNPVLDRLLLPVLPAWPVK
jgi:radical SAM protein with 4Fe4S-binding SPASM domain